MFAWKSAALSPAATPLIKSHIDGMDAPACTSTLPITASSYHVVPYCSMSFQGPRSQHVPILLLRLFRKLRQLKGLHQSERFHAWPMSWHIGAPWSHSERCPAPEEPRQEGNDPRGKRTQHPRNGAETRQQPPSLRTPLKSSRIELAGDRMILLPRLSFPQTQNSVS